MREVSAHTEFQAVLTFRRVFCGLDFWHYQLITPGVHFDADKFWAQILSSIRRQTGKPWMVLHHVPPKRGPIVSGEESEASDLLLTYRPDYFVCGHDHEFPYVSGQSWRQNVGEVGVLVPGQLL